MTGQPQPGIPTTSAGEAPADISRRAGETAADVSRRAGETAADVSRRAGDPPSPYETRYGFSRSVTAGSFVMVGGTTSVDDLGFVVGRTPYEQAVEVLAKLERELIRAGVGLADVVQSRAYVTDISRSDDVGRAFADIFGDIRPLFTMVEVSALIDPRMLVEIEVVAYRAAVPPQGL